MKNKIALDGISTKMWPCPGLNGISGPALFLISMVILVAGCAKDTINDQSVTTPPADVVAATIPANLADTVVIDPVLIVNFKNGTIPSDVSSSKITLQQGTTLVPGTVSYSTASISFKPDNDLLPFTRYTASVITSFNVNKHEWSFTTGINHASSMPTVVSAYPLFSACSVSIPGTVQPSVTFSEEIDKSTINSETFILFQGTKPVSGTISYSGMTATFKPNIILTGGTVYTGTVTTGVKNVNGIPLAYGYAWNFTTEANE